MYDENNRQCIFCEHQLKSSSDYIKHCSKCKAWLCQISRIIINNHISIAEHVISFSSFSFYDTFSSPKIHATWTESESDNAVINNACDILKMREKSVRDALECNQEHTTSSAFYLEHFNDSQFKSDAEMSVLKHCNMCFEMSDENNEYYSYANEADFTAAVWFYIRELSKSDVTDFFEQCALHQWHSTLSFTNSSEWLNNLHQILYEIWDDKWNAVNIAILWDANDSELTEYTFYYRNVMKTVEFLIRHELFKNNLTYASVQTYSSKDKARHMYNELHTENWWWKIQKQLSHDITIISLLLETDKTLLIMLHDDQLMWLIYLIIENLDTVT